MQRWEFAELEWVDRINDDENWIEQYARISLGLFAHLMLMNKHALSYPEPEERRLVEEHGKVACINLLGWYGFELVGNREVFNELPPWDASNPGKLLFRRALPPETPSPIELVIANAIQTQERKREHEEYLRKKAQLKTQRREWCIVNNIIFDESSNDDY